MNSFLFRISFGHNEKKKQIYGTQKKKRKEQIFFSKERKKKWNYSQWCYSPFVFVFLYLYKLNSALMPLNSLNGYEWNQNCVHFQLKKCNEFKPMS